MTPRKSTKYIAIHCSATRPSLDVGVKEIREWHKNQGWEDIGYHYVIRRNGKVEKGRPEGMVGAHVANFNATSIGVCLVGGVSQKDYTKAENNFTSEQFAALKVLLTQLVAKYPGVVIKGHRDFPRVAKACPSFDAIAWAKKEGLPNG
jgi:N-acetylmuramoyl-L-alanine amidase